MPALRSLTEILSQNLTDTLTPHGAIQLNLFNPGILPRVLNRLNPKIPEFQLSEFFWSPLRLCVCREGSPVSTILRSTTVFNAQTTTLMRRT